MGWAARANKSADLASTSGYRKLIPAEREEQRQAKPRLSLKFPNRRIAQMSAIAAMMSPRGGR